MAFTVRVVFEGVLGFVPNEPFFHSAPRGAQPGKPSTLSVLVPDLRAPALAGWEDGITRDKPDPRYRSAHVPVLLVDPLAVRGAHGLSPSSLFVDPASGRLRAAYLLAGVVMTLPELGPLTFESAVSRQPLPPSADSPKRRSLWWLPRMADIAPDSQLAKKELLEANGDQLLLQGVAARIDTRGGHLSVAGFNSGGGQSWLYASVRRNPETGALESGNEDRWARAVANRIALEGQSENAAKLSFDLIGGEAELVLEPTGSNDVVEVIVANIEPEVLFLGESSPFGENPLPDPDFEPFYDLSTAPPTASRLFPVRAENARGQNEKPCAPGTYSGAG